MGFFKKLIKGDLKGIVNDAVKDVGDFAVKGVKQVLGGHKSVGKPNVNGRIDQFTAKEIANAQVKAIKLLQSGGNRYQVKQALDQEVRKLSNPISKEVLASVSQEVVKKDEKSLLDTLITEIKGNAGTAVDQLLNGTSKNVEVKAIDKSKPLEMGSWWSEWGKMASIVGGSVVALGGIIYLIFKKK